MKLTLRQAAERLGTTRQNVYRLAKRRKLLKKEESPGTVNGWLWVIREQDLKKLRNEQP